VKLSRLDEDNRRWREIEDLYIKNINHPDIVLPGLLKTQHPAPSTQSLEPSDPELAHVWHLFVIRHPHRDELQKYLTDNGVQALIHYPVPPHKQKAYLSYNDLTLPVTKKIHNAVVSLPISQVMSDDEVETVIKILNNYM
jgi:dTDP-4-amino-4,6-dideoxygalactose transaminase